MIIIKLSGGLGNNMFQYVAVRSLAIYKNFPFSYYKVKGINYFYRKIIRILRKKLFNKEHIFQKQLSNNDLSKYFILDQPFLRMFLYRILWFFINKDVKLFFHQKINPNDYLLEETKIDNSFFNVKPYTKLSGPFSSEKYFMVNRDLILKWFEPKPKIKKKLDKLIDNHTQSVEKSCCIHVRRGDALFMDKGYDFNGLGWGLPIEYYKYIIDLLPNDLLFIFVSDDTKWVEENFSYLQNKLIYKDNPEIIDLLMFTKCKYNIIARSTFSWWGAWLNKIEDKVVYAPKYFIGIPKDFCFPLGLDLGEEASKWNYINLKNLELKIR